MTLRDMLHLPCFALLCLMIAAGRSAGADSDQPFRPPAVPLVTHDPYFSTWSMCDRLTEDWSKHWTGANVGMGGMVRIDGEPFRYMAPQPDSVPVMRQTGVQVFPTRTAYTFESAGIELTLTFTSPLLPRDLDIFARPVTYLTWDVRSTDGKSHDVVLYFDTGAEWCVNTPDQKVVWQRSAVGGLAVSRFGTEEQPVLAKAGDNLRIDWGYFYVAVPSMGSDQAILEDRVARESFVTKGTLPDADDAQMPRSASDRWPVIACVVDCGQVGEKPVSRHILLAYDDVYSIEYMRTRLRPYWRRNGMEAPDLLRLAERDYSDVLRKCREFDEALMKDLAKIGGERYARLGALAYRQCIAGHKLAADAEGRPTMFSKENTSNGCIATVDVLYPASPLLMLLSPELLKANLTPILEYARSSRWPHPFAPHDLGTFPLANGQVYGGGERTVENQMPVEESGNMIIMVAAVARAEGSAKYAARYWSLLTKWAEYLREKGMDPENQLCTDDFTGHLAHNANLSIKAIEALGAYAMLCEMMGKEEPAFEYRKIARVMAEMWIIMANDGDHSRLAFDKPGTWSMKYNLVWDRLLGLDLFGPEVARREITWYKMHQNRFGLPLDSRATLTKSDWLVWSAALAERREDFEALIAPLYDYLDRTSRRVPFTDLYWTDKADEAWLHSRPVIGGVFIRMLHDARIWKKWAAKAGD